jgi:23S rRNA pseudouridine1911/1915/1917 synthase
MESWSYFNIYGTTNMLEVIWGLLAGVVVLMVGILVIMRFRLRYPLSWQLVAFHYLFFVLIALDLQSLAAPWPTEMEADAAFFSVREIFYASIIAICIHLFSYIQENMAYDSKSGNGEYSYKINMIFLGILLFIATIFNTVILAFIPFRLSGLQAPEAAISSITQIIGGFRSRTDLWPHNRKYNRFTKWGISIRSRNKERLSIIPLETRWNSDFLLTNYEGISLNGRITYSCDKWMTTSSYWDYPYHQKIDPQMKDPIAELKSRNISSFPWNWIGKKEIGVEKVESTKNAGSYLVTTSNKEIWRWYSGDGDNFSFVSSPNTIQNGCFAPNYPLDELTKWFILSLMVLNNGYSYLEELGARAVGHTLLSYLACYFSHSSQQAWQGHLDLGEVLLDGVPSRGTEVLRAGQRVVWNRPPWLEEDAPLHYELVYQDPHMVAVNKPSGLPTLPGGGFLQHTLLNVVRRDFPEASPLHRLGRCTSGLVLFARDKAAAAQLSKDLRDRDLEKRYVALGQGLAQQERFEIRAAIGPVPHPRLGMVFAASATGKASHSVATVLERRETSDSTLFQVDILSGRPHQIRIHLAYVGHPLVGDPLYAAGGLPLTHLPGLPGDGGYFLHAARLVFLHPLSRERIWLEAEIPEILRVGARSFV